MGVQEAISLLSLSLLFGTLLSLLFEKLKLPSFVGFFLAGTVVGQTFGDFLNVEFAISLALTLIAFEIGRELGAGGFTPVSIFAVLIEAPIVLGLSFIVGYLFNFNIFEILIIAIMFISSSTIFIYKSLKELDVEVKKVLFALTTLEDLALFFLLSLITGEEFHPLVGLVLLTIFALVGLLFFRRIFSSLIGKEYSVVLAIASALGYVSLIEYMGVASPFIGAFIIGYVFSSADEARVHDAEIKSLSTVVVYMYMLIVGLSLPKIAAFRLDVFLLALFIAAAAVAIRAIALFTSSLFTVGDPQIAIRASLYGASISELSPIVPVLAYTYGVIKNADFVTALALSPLAAFFITPLLTRRADYLAQLIGQRVVEFKAVVFYERLYKLMSQIFLTSAKLTIIILIFIILISYNILLIFIVIPIFLYLSIRYIRRLWNDLLLALAERRKAFLLNTSIMFSSAALALYVISVIYKELFYAMPLLAVLIIAASSILLYELLKRSA